ncbi:hypothetical protein PAPYR_4935 [Paratrimastix pyriformis]|uniref:EF-hand domain-containing protein n=1 Tax=Paratrimastix pyriformis TaxID=342808 RepID=A0ABQ8UQZ5_9EUKA|nr:hypothetical protein PAPYR_4935 [Paratrimastix pyriformis]
MFSFASQRTSLSSQNKRLCRIAEKSRFSPRSAPDVHLLSNLPSQPLDQFLSAVVHRFLLPTLFYLPNLPHFPPPSFLLLRQFCPIVTLSSFEDFGNLPGQNVPSLGQVFFRPWIFIPGPSVEKKSGMEARRRLLEQQEFDNTCHQAFDAADSDHSGFIDQGELMEVLRVVCQACEMDVPTDEQVQKTMQQLDTDGNGKLSYPEFKEFLKFIMTD